MNPASKLDLPGDAGATPAMSVVLYDGVCGLCNRYVAFILRRDRRGRFRFASLQGPYGTEARGRHALLSRHDIDSIVLLELVGSSRERARIRSDAVLAVVAGLGGPWRLVAVLRVIPSRLRDWIYDRVARARYRIFGRLDACPVPAAKDRPRFLD